MNEPTVLRPLNRAQLARLKEELGFDKGDITVSVIYMGESFDIPCCTTDKVPAWADADIIDPESM